MGQGGERGEGSKMYELRERREDEGVHKRSYGGEKRKKMIKGRKGQQQDRRMKARGRILGE